MNYSISLQQPYRLKELAPSHRCEILVSERILLLILSWSLNSFMTWGLYMSNYSLFQRYNGKYVKDISLALTFSGLAGTWLWIWYLLEASGKDICLLLPNIIPIYMTKWILCHKTWVKHLSYKCIYLLECIFPESDTSHIGWLKQWKRK